MQISIGDRYVITSDKYQFILNQKMRFKDGKNAGESYLKQIGFYPRISQLVNALIMIDAREADIESMAALEKRIALFCVEIELAFNQAPKEPEVA
ncbi:DUF5405 family protein [Martelella alba]|uniref:DUF5405 domain-containing protein n=1 Tax=Martelella alba TaxID=2590451 RepID=A0ABY2SKR3_9HYPH|nr:DUF5405 family protein [Martelella alba]TKI06226.1 hypothetical protein FCN80_10285 [Martelella alba]